MFFPIAAPPEAAGRELFALCLSLNAPVVAIEQLPVGPASAAIALRVDQTGQPWVVVAVCSLRAREIAFFAPDEDLQDLPSSRVALDAALSFAESMGFLFDDDLVEAAGDAGPAEAEGVWLEFCGLEPPEAPGEPAAEPTPPRESLAEAAPEPAGPEISPPPAVADPPAGDSRPLRDARVQGASPAAAAPGPLSLTKFRHLLPGARLGEGWGDRDPVRDWAGSG